MQEVWLPVVGYEGLYEVSDQGQVRSLDRAVVQMNRGGNCVRVYAGRVLRQVPDAKGYQKVCLSKEGRHKSRSVHHLVLEAFVGPRPAGLVTRHGPEGVASNALRNLCYGTQRENIQDRRRDGTDVSGERNPRARLTEEKVREIRADGRMGIHLAKVYGVSESTIYAVKNNETWTHVK